MTGTRWLGVAAVLLFFAVAAGAFGAHALKEKLDAYQTAVWEKAVLYHFVHAIGMLLVVALAAQQLISEAAATRVSLLLCLGIILFSGSLYALALSGIRTLGAITPLGGLSFLAAWALLAVDAFGDS